ncbi:MAG: segregation/condensation protein A [Christensenellales bacterium]
MMPQYNEYKVSIQHFEGPLDLLLHLIGKARIDIEQIFVSDVTGQYLEYIASISDFSLDHASEFIEMAAALVLIKSRMILPDGADEENTEEENPERELVERLKAYKAYKDAAENLKEREPGALNVFYKYPEEVAFSSEKWEIEQISLDLLCETYFDVLQRQPNSDYERIEEVQIQKDVYTIKERSRFILRTLSKMGNASFFSLFTGTRTRLEVAVTFAALLELLHKSVITIRQEECYEDIFIIKKNKETAV